MSYQSQRFYSFKLKIHVLRLNKYVWDSKAVKDDYKKNGSMNITITAVSFQLLLEIAGFKKHANFFRFTNSTK